MDDDELDAAESQTLAWAAKEFGTLSRCWEIESGLRGYRWYDDLPCIIGVNVHMRRGTETRTSTRKTRRYGEHPFRGAIDEIEIELLVKRAGCDVPGKVRIPAARDGGGASRPEPIFVTHRDAPIDRDALANPLTEAYFQPSFDSDADSVDTQMREYRRRIAYIVTELLESREAAADADLRDLVTTCILPSMSGDSNVDIEIRARRPHGDQPDLTAPAPARTPNTRSNTRRQRKRDPPPVHRRPSRLELRRRRRPRVGPAAQPLPHPHTATQTRRTNARRGRPEV